MQEKIKDIPEFEVQYTDNEGNPQTVPIRAHSYLEAVVEFRHAYGGMFARQGKVTSKHPIKAITQKSTMS